jgi:predicted nucleic acid-binding protein
VLYWRTEFFRVAPPRYEVTRRSWRIDGASRFGWWDRTPISSALLAAAKYFRKDLQHERQPQGMTIVNPVRLDPYSNRSE